MISQERAKAIADYRFWRFVEKADNCWNYKTLTTNGRGQVTLSRNLNKMTAYRFSYLLYYGVFDEKLYVLHKCDNPACVRPDHLFLGTQADNMRDMVSKNRQIKGENNSQHKLTKEQVNEIRACYKRGKTSYRRLARKYKVAHSLIRYIVINVKWRET